MAGGNIEQTLFEVFPPFPVSIALNFIFASLPYLDVESVRKGLVRLRERGLVERLSRGVYRLTEGAKRPQDHRGGFRG